MRRNRVAVDDDRRMCAGELDAALANWQSLGPQISASMTQHAGD